MMLHFKTMLFVALEFSRGEQTVICLIITLPHWPCGPRTIGGAA